MKGVIGVGNVEVGRLVPARAMKTYSRRGGIAPLFLHFSTRYRWEVNIRLWSIRSRNDPGNCWTGSWVRPDSVCCLSCVV